MSAGRQEARSGRALKRAFASTVIVAGALGACFVDPVHDNEVSALGGEQQGVPPGPTHRPGQPCLVCHGGSGPANVQFSAGGTIFESQTGAPAVPLPGATITLVDTNRSFGTGTTNAVGNFYVLQSDWAPTFPVHVDAVAYAGVSTPMLTHIGRDASCATCHYDPAGPETPGHVFLVNDPSDFPAADGGSQ